MQENKKRELLDSKLREELNWYTLYASDEEYDQKAVDSILYLLDRWEPLKEGTVPPVEESWKRFLKVAGGKELLPLEDEAEAQKPVAGEGEVEARKSVSGISEAEARKQVEGEVEARKPVAGRSEVERLKLMPGESEAEAQKSVSGISEDEARKPVPGEDEARKSVSGISEDEARKSVSGISEAEARKSVSGRNEAEAQKQVPEESEAAFLATQKRKTGEGLLPANETVEGLRSVQKAESGEALFLSENAGEDKPESIKEDIAGNIVQISPEEDEDLSVVGTGKQNGHKKAGKLAKFASRHKMIAAAVLVLMVLMVGNTIHAVANPERGFFFWLDRDDSGVKMMTSPEGLDVVTNDDICTYYNQEDVPEWAKEWTQIETGIDFGTQDAYELSYIEISESDNRQHIASHYMCESLNKEIVVGVWVYWDKVSYFKEEFVGYDFVQSYEFAGKDMDIYKRTEDTGRIYYTICFYEENCKCYVTGQNLDEIKKINEECWIYMQNNL